MIDGGFIRMEKQESCIPCIMQVQRWGASTSKKSIVLLAMLLFLLSFSHASGGKEDFTSKHLKEYSNILDKVVFYVEDDLVLERTLDEWENPATTNDGEIFVSAGKFIQRIIIKKDTPGKLSKSSKNKISVTFSKERNRNLSFSEEFVGGDFKLDAGFSGKVSYDGKTYHVNKKVKLQCVVNEEYIKNIQKEYETGGW